jgi:hypothetical protein
VFWCMFGGVPGSGGVSTEDSEVEEDVEIGVDGSDMMLRAGWRDCMREKGFDSQVLGLKATVL